MRFLKFFGPDTNTVDWYTKLGILKAHSLGYKTKRNSALSDPVSLMYDNFKVDGNSDITYGSTQYLR